MSAFPTIMQKHVETGLTNIEAAAITATTKASSPRSIFHLFNNTKSGQCMGDKCGKTLTSDDKDHSYCNTCWDTIFSAAPKAAAKKKKKVTFAPNTKEHDGQNAETTAFGQFFELTLMEGVKPSDAITTEKIAPHAAKVIEMVKDWLAEYDRLWEEHPTGIVDTDRKVSAFSKKLTEDSDRDWWVADPKAFKLPVLKQGGSSTNLALSGYEEHARLLAPIRAWMKTCLKEHADSLHQIFEAASYGLPLLTAYQNWCDAQNDFKHFGR